MARNLYILAGTLVVFAVVSFGMMLAGQNVQPGVPIEDSLWKTMGLFLMLGALGVALLATLTALFEQVDRRAHLREENARQARPKRGGTAL